MSILIGVTSTVTTRERIILESSSESNMIVLKSPSLSETSILFDNGLKVGRSNSEIAFYQNSTKLASFGDCNTTIYTPFSLASSFNTSDDANFRQLVTSNIKIAPLADCNIYFNVPDYFVASKDTVTIQGNVGIGTTNLLLNQRLHIHGNAYISGDTTTNRITTTVNANRIDLADNTVEKSLRLTAAKTVVDGDMSVLGGLTFNTNTEIPGLRIASNVQTNTLTVANNNHLSLQPTLRLSHNSASLCNAVEINVIESGASQQVLYINSDGFVGIGATRPKSLLQVSWASRLDSCNVATFEGEYEDQFITINRSANIGIGTIAPLHPFHIEASTDAFTQPLVGLYNRTLENIPVFAAYSDEMPVIQYATHGAGTITVGDIPVNSNWNIDVSCNARIPYIETGRLTGPPSTQMITMDGTTVCNVNDLFGCNLYIEKLTSVSNLITNYFFASNYSIIGLDIFHSDGYFSINTASFWFPGSNILMSPSISNLWVNTKTEGKMRIETDLTTNASETAIGLHVYGRSNSGIRVSSDKSPAFFITKSNQNIHGEFKIDEATGTFRVDYRSNGNPYPVFTANANAVFLGSRVAMTSSTGYLIVNTDTPTVLRSDTMYPLDTKGDVMMRGNSGNSAILFVNGDTKRVGIGGITNPTYGLHVMSNVFIQDDLLVKDGNVGIGLTAPASYKLQVNGNSFVSGSNFVMGNVGIGTSSAGAFRLNVNGDINFEGSLFQGGSRYVSSQWTTSSAPAPLSIFYNGNVGINTSSSAFPLFVQGTTVLQGNVGIGTTRPLVSSGLHINNGSLILSGTSANIGIGTTTPIAPFHNVGIAFFQGSVGIGTTTPNFALHIGSDINFDGNIYQRGAAYISSQWETIVPSGTLSNIYYRQNGNVGIGTLTPQSLLHVHGTGYYHNRVVFNSNVDVRGLLTTQGNIASVSDRMVKTNLTKIEDSLQKVDTLTGYVYDRIDTHQRECGLIAQEVQYVLPEAVFVTDSHHLSIAYGNLSALFVEAIKELKSEIKDLKQRVYDLESASITRS